MYNPLPGGSTTMFPMEKKKHLNFSEFTKRKIAVQNHKLEEIVEMMEEGEMPLKSYTWLGLHPEAKLSAEQKTGSFHGPNHKWTRSKTGILLIHWSLKENKIRNG